MKFISIGFGNHINIGRVISVVSPESAPIKRLIQESKEAGNLIDASLGRKTKSVLVTDSRHVILSALSTEVISTRLNGETSDDATESINEENMPID
jgi:regulator of extracellular matrix RemA (YlzA/DUF370 family)